MGQLVEPPLRTARVGNVRQHVQQRREHSHGNRLWCTIQIVDVEHQLKALLASTLGHRPAEAGHPAQHRAGGLGFGLLGRQGPGAEAAAEDGLVAEHGRLRV